MTISRAIDCETASDLAAVFVLGALPAHEAAQVRLHLATCREPHPEFAELGGAAQYLAESVEPVVPPPALRQSILSAVRAEATQEPRVSPDVASAAATQPLREPASLAERRARGVSRGRADASVMPLAGFRRWALPAAAALVIVVLGAWNLALHASRNEAERRTEILRSAVATLARPDAAVARLSGTPAAAEARGFAAIPPEGEGYLVVTGLPPAGSGRTYQAWYITGGRPQSAGLLDVGADGIAVLPDLAPAAGLEAMALTNEPAGGLSAPSGPILADGAVQRADPSA